MINLSALFIESSHHLLFFFVQFSDSSLQYLHLSFKDLASCILIRGDAGHHFAWRLFKLSKMSGRCPRALWGIVDEVDTNKLSWLDVAWRYIAGIAKRGFHLDHVMNRRRYWRILHLEETVLIFKHWAVSRSLMWVYLILSRWNLSWYFVCGNYDFLAFDLSKVALCDKKRSVGPIMSVCIDWTSFISSS